jgi:eukaryotic-like serine/threonine-protein kinase
VLDSEELRWTDPNDAPEEEGTLVGGSIDAAEALADFDAGAKLGRYVVLSHMGTGGMGVVYAAYDPELDRRIALKLMHQRGDDEEQAQRASQRMLAEAKAMAQLSHPNVITVHDVGTIDGRVFIAMEFVEGKPLSQWMREPGRDWRELLDMFIRAGRGLEAAHAAGLVHRDFKPDNVLVGADGRVRVLDFGLARRIDGVREPGERRDREAGTPAYMSPEQHLGKPSDHRADQFSFCVALYEALYGSLPFSAKTRLELALAVTDGRVGPAPKRASVPNWVRWALLRGLDPDPDGRWDDMASLLEALSHDPYHKVRRAGAGAVAVVVALALLLFVIKVGLARTGGEAPSPRQCTSADERVAAVWNQDRAASVRRAIAEVDDPRAAELVDQIEAGLAGWAAGWAEMHRDTCEASRAGAQSDTMLDRRMLCLDRRLAEFDELVAVVTGAEALARAREVLRVLPALSSCEAAVIEAGGDLGAELDEHERAVVVALQHDLFRASTGVMTGAFAEAKALAEAGAAQARELGNQGLLADASLILAKLAIAQGDPGSAAPLLEDAELAAERAGADRVRSEVLIALARVELELGNTTMAARRAREARAVLDRVGAEELSHAVLDGVVARISVAVGDLDEAEGRARAALTRVEALEPAPVEAAELHRTLGIVLRELGRHAEARVEFEEAIVAWTGHYGGEQHPSIAGARFELALVDRREGRLEAALSGYAAALAIYEQVFGANSLEVGRASEAMAGVLAELPRHREALRRYQQARSVFRANLRSEASDDPVALALARALDGEALVRQQMAQPEEAVSLHRQALTILERVASPRPELALERARVQVHLAEILDSLGRGAEAREGIEQAIVVLAASGEPQRSSLARARAVAARAWAAGDHSGDRGDLERARSHARDARRTLVELGEQQAVEALDGWLEELGGA